MLVSRVAYLIKRKNVSPSSILAVTFTKKAAMEMKNRLEYLLLDTDEINLTSEYSNKSINNPNEKDEIKTKTRGGKAVVTCTTLHSFCCRLLRTYSSSRDFTLYDTSACKKIVKDLLKEADKDDVSAGIASYSPGDVYSAISTIKRQMLKRVGYRFDDKLFDKADSILHNYNQVVKSNNAYDFDDLILETLKLMLMNGGAAKGIRSRYKHIFCDEWQDVDKSQYSLLLMLLDPSSRKLHFGSDIDNFMKVNKIPHSASKLTTTPSEDTDHEGEVDGCRTFFVVGDADQTIFSWRGADNRNLNYFADDIPS